VLIWEGSPLWLIEDLRKESDVAKRTTGSVDCLLSGSVAVRLMQQFRWLSVEQLRRMASDIGRSSGDRILSRH
jgi:hypothetical protein